MRGLIGKKVKLLGNPFDEQIPEELEKYLNLKDKEQIIIEVKDVSKLEGTSGVWVKTSDIPDWVDMDWFVVLNPQPPKPTSNH